MLGRLTAAGWTVTDEPDQAETIVVNTCGFIASAADESIDTILEMARFKRQGTCRRLIVAGCLPQRYREPIADALPEVDCFLGTGAFDEIVSAVGGTGPVCRLPDPDLTPVQGQSAPRLLTSVHTAYLKIAEGCSRHCTYCIIPRLRGRQKSRHPDAIVAEAAALIAGGAKELTLVAQDTTHYGSDLAPPTSLGRLLNRLSALSDTVWLRVLYGHPSSIDEPTIRAIGGLGNVCPYFDLPIQHASDRVLRRMGRGYTQAELYRLFDRIRDLVPDAALRTTVIVGFPGETDADFKELMDFIQTVGFDHLGTFVYSDSEDLPSHGLDHPVSTATARRRRDRLMSAQQELSRSVNGKHVGKPYPVLIEAHPEPDLFVGRTQFQAPEVDGVTYVKWTGDGQRPKVGDMTTSRITEAMAYDLAGETP